MSRLRRRLRLGLPEHSTRHLLDDIRKGTPDGLSPHLSFSSARSAGPRNYGLKRQTVNGGDEWLPMVTTNVQAFVFSATASFPINATHSMRMASSRHSPSRTIRRTCHTTLPNLSGQEAQCATRNSVTDSKMLFGKWACSSMTPIALRLSTSRTPCGIGKSISVDPHLRARNRSPFRPRSASGGPRSMRLDPTRARKTFTCNLLGGGNRLGLHAGGRG